MTNRHLRRLPLSSTALALGALASTGHAVLGQTLYDGSLGSTPSNQGWLALGNLSLTGPKATETYNAAGGYTTLDSTVANAVYAGYANYSVAGTPVNPAFPNLDSSQGFTLSFTTQITNEAIVPTSTTTNPRAGFSVILLDNQHKGIELGFDTNSIFSQAADFTSASEFAASALTASLTTYSLNIKGSIYTLSSGGLQLLSGATKQYTSASPLGSTVYNEPNFVFLGDDTTSNAGSFNLKSASINAPEPTTLAFVLMGIVGVAARRFRKQ